MDTNPAQITVGSISSWLQQHLARVTFSNRFIPEIDGLRFIAITTVLMYHINGYMLVNGSSLISQQALGSRLNAVLQVFNYGVQLFFAISGFVLALPFAQQHIAQGKPMSLKSYYLRRVTRIEPPYIIVLLVWFAMLVFVKKVDAGFLLPHLLTSMVYLNNVIYITPPLICYVAWSLEVEVQFYLTAPLLAKVFLVRTKWLRRVLIAATALVFAGHPFKLPIGPNLIEYLHYFLIGFLLADLYVTDWKEPPVSRTLWDLITTFSWIALVIILMRYEAMQFSTIACIFLAYAGTFRGRFWNWLLTRPLLTTIGGMCYTIYLYHPLIKSMIAKYTVHLVVGDHYWINAILQIVLLYPPIIIICAVLFAFTERPFMRREWPQQLIGTIRKHLKTPAS